METKTQNFSLVKLVLAVVCAFTLCMSAVMFSACDEKGEKDYTATEVATALDSVSTILQASDETVKSMDLTSELVTYLNTNPAYTEGTYFKKTLVVSEVSRDFAIKLNTNKTDGKIQVIFAVMLNPEESSGMDASIVEYNITMNGTSIAGLLINNYNEVPSAPDTLFVFNYAIPTSTWSTITKQTQDYYTGEHAGQGTSANMLTTAETTYYTNLITTARTLLTA